MPDDAPHERSAPNIRSIIHRSPMYVKVLPNLTTHPAIAR